MYTRLYQPMKYMFKCLCVKCSLFRCDINSCKQRNSAHVLNLSIENGGRIAGNITIRQWRRIFTLEDVEKADNTYVYHLLALDDAIEQGSDLEVSDIESESDRESETESSDDDDIVLADYNRWTVREFTGH